MQGEYARIDLEVLDNEVRVECAWCDRPAWGYCFACGPRCQRDRCNCGYIWIGEEWFEHEGDVIHSSGLARRGDGVILRHEQGEYNFHGTPADRPRRACKVWRLWRTFQDRPAERQ